MNIDNSVIDQITQGILGFVHKVGETREEVQRKVRDVVQDAVEQLDLVTREEFEATRELLGNTRIKLETLEKKLSELEEQLGRDKDAGEDDAPET